NDWRPEGGQFLIPTWMSEVQVATGSPFPFKRPRISARVHRTWNSAQITPYRYAALALGRRCCGLAVCGPGGSGGTLPLAGSGGGPWPRQSDGDRRTVGRRLRGSYLGRAGTGPGPAAPAPDRGTNRSLRILPGQPRSEEHTSELQSR